MCSFFSCIVTKEGKVVWDVEKDSHDDLLIMAGIADKTADPDKMRFARVEITPPNGDVFEKDIKKWTLKVDQTITPHWFTEHTEKLCFGALKECLAEVIIDGETLPLLEKRNGLWIRNSKIEVVKNCKIRVMRGSSQVGVMRESSQVGEMRGSSTRKIITITGIEIIHPEDLKVKLSKHKNVKLKENKPHETMQVPEVQTSVDTED